MSLTDCKLVGPLRCSYCCSWNYKVPQSMPNVHKKRAQSRRYYIQNQDKKKAASRASYSASPEKKRAASRASYSASPEKKRAASRASYQADPDKRKSASRASYKASPEKKRAASRASYKADPDKRKAASRAKYNANPVVKKAAARMHFVKTAVAKVKWYRKYYSKHRGRICASRRSRYALAEPRPVVKELYVKEIQCRLVANHGARVALLEACRREYSSAAKHLPKGVMNSLCKIAAKRLVNKALQLRKEHAGVLLKTTRAVNGLNITGRDDFGEGCHTASSEPYIINTLQHTPPFTIITILNRDTTATTLTSTSTITYLTKHNAPRYSQPKSPQHSIPFHAISPKKHPKQDIEKALYKKCKKHSCRDALPPRKNTSPKTKETSDNAHRKACTDYPHMTAECIYCVPTIPTSFQPHPPQTGPHPHTQHPSPSTIITILSPQLYHP